MKSENRLLKVTVLGREVFFAMQVICGIKKQLLSSTYSHFSVHFCLVSSLEGGLMPRAAREILSSNQHLIVTVGTGATRAILQAGQECGLNAPVVYVGTGDPVATGLVSTLEKRPESVTGFTIKRIVYENPVELLLKAMPGLKQVLIPYFPASLGGGIGSSASHVQRLFAQNGVKAHLVPLSTAREIEQKITPLIDEVDALMCLAGDRIDEVYSQLIELCNKHKCVLFAKDIEAVKQGAALGYGSTVEGLGVSLMEYAHKILVDGVEAGELPVQFVEGNRIFVVNKTAAAKQGLEVTPELLALADQMYE